MDSTGWYIDSTGTSSTELTTAGTISVSTTPNIVVASDDFTTRGGLKGKLQYKQNNGAKRLPISPKVYFNFVKMKLNKLEMTRLKERLGKLQKLVQESKELGQHTLHEHTALMLAVVARESEAYACGFKYWVKKNVITKYISNVKDKVIKFDKFEEFPRTVPVGVRNKIRAVKKKELFDELWVLYTDYTGEKLKSNKQKIKEKDPILFGKYAYQNDRFYFIADWEDEYCDLTLDEMVKVVERESNLTAVNEVPEVDEDLIKEIRRQVMRRHKRLEGTNQENYKELMKEEDEEKKVEPVVVQPKKKGFWKRLWS